MPVDTFRDVSKKQATTVATEQSPGLVTAMTYLGNDLLWPRPALATLWPQPLTFGQLGHPATSKPILVARPPVSRTHSRAPDTRAPEDARLRPIRLRPIRLRPAGRSRNRPKSNKRCFLFFAVFFFNLYLFFLALRTSSSNQTLNIQTQNTLTPNRSDQNWPQLWPQTPLPRTPSAGPPSATVFILSSLSWVSFR